MVHALVCTVRVLAIIAGAAVFRQNLSTLAQLGTCSQANVSNETAGTPDVREMFARFFVKPVTCTGRIVSWEVCYYGPTNPLEDEPYEVVYAVYRRDERSNGSGDTRYVKISNTFSIKLRKIVDDGCGDGEDGSGEDDEGGSKEDGSGEDGEGRGKGERVRGSMHSGNTMTYSPLHEGFHCNSYKMTNTSTGYSSVIQAEDIIGVCVKNPNSTVMDVQHQLGIVGVNTSEDSLFHMSIDNCGTEPEDGFPSVVLFDQLSHLDLTRLHLYVKTGKCSGNTNF